MMTLISHLGKKIQGFSQPRFLGENVYSPLKLTLHIYFQHLIIIYF